MKNFPLVSIIVTTKNEEKNIGHCLQSIKEQVYPCDKLEIVVVDSNSTDRTKEIAKKYTSKVFNREPERSAQRNFGIEKASGKYILYLDADMILSEKVVEECVNKCEGEDCIALYIPERIVSLPTNKSVDNFFNRRNHSYNLRNQPFLIRVRDFERSFYNATVIDCVRFIRRDKFLDVGGFDTSLTGPEDWDFDRRIKATGKVDIIDTPLYHNERKFNIRKYLKKKGYYSQFFNRYIQKWGKNDFIIRKQLGFWYRLFGVFMEKGKWKRLLRHPLLTIGMYFLRVMVGIEYFRSKGKKGE